MARPLRLDPPGGWHHVFNRRPQHRLLVRSEADRHELLDLLRPFERRFGVEVHAYAIMDTHFHLLLRSRSGGLARAMRDFQHRWSLVLSQRYGEVGPAFQTRYGSRLIEDEQYLAVVVAYIHLNPVLERLAPSPDAALWTSHPDYRSLRPSPPWLHTDRLIAHFGGADVLHDEVMARADLPIEVFEQALEPIRRSRGPHTAPVRESPEEGPGIALDQLLTDLEAIVGEDLAALGPPRVGSGPNTALHLAIYVLSRHSLLTHAEIGEMLHLSTRQVDWVVQAQRRGLSPAVLRLVGMWEEFSGASM